MSKKISEKKSEEILKKKNSKKKLWKQNSERKNIPEKQILKEKTPEKYFPKKSARKFRKNLGPKGPPVCSRRLQFSAGARIKPPVGRQIFYFLLYFDD